jgi:hypothetical protein
MKFPFPYILILGEDCKQIKSPTRVRMKPVYVSLTTISARIDTVQDTLLSLLNQFYRIDRLTLYISKEPYLIDKGIPEIPEELQCLSDMDTRFQVEYTENLGPYRKLLPELRKRWKEDCILITVDDDKIYDPDMILNMVNTFYDTGENYIVANRAFVKINTAIARVCKRWCGMSTEIAELLEEAIRRKLTAQGIAHALGKDYPFIQVLTFPEGNDGVLYHPKFFTPLVFQWKLIRRLARTHDDFWFKMCALCTGYGVISVPSTGQRGSAQIGDTMKSALHFNINIGSYDDVLRNLCKWMRREGLLEMGIRKLTTRHPASTVH